MFWYILFAVIGLVFDYVIAAEMKSIAESKGCKTSKRYFWFCFLLGLPGWLMVVALPNQKKENLLQTLINDQHNSQVQTSKPEKEKIQISHVKEKPATLSNSQNTSKGSAPIAERTAAAVAVDDKTIKCTQCSTVQNAGRRVCWECGATFVKEG